MKTYKTYTNCLFGILSFVFLLFSSCKKNESHDDGIPAASFDSSIPDSAYFGDRLKIDFIAKNLRSGILTISPENNSESIAFQQNIDNPNNLYLFSTEIDIPEDGSWEGNYLINLKFENITVSRKVVFSKSPIRDFYVLGGSSSAGWEPALAIKSNRFTKEEDDKIIEWFDYFGYLTSSGDGLKLIPTNTGWDGDMGMKPGEPGKIVSEDEENIPVPADGFYRLRLKMADITNQTYELVPSQWGVIGDATTGQWDNDMDMTFTNPEKGKYEWSITVDLVGGKHFKFRENDMWDVSLGAAEGNDLSYTGSNIPVAKDGLYLIKLILEPTGYRYSIEEK